MSASLVGSEMCIRDSHHCLIAHVQTAEHQARCPICRHDLTGTGQATVSYTHLTLPTICSV
eukprot:2098017-Alexandrium_andersonii.AAC.1